MPRFKSNYTGIRGWRYVVQTSMDILEVERYFLNTCISVQLSFPYYFLQYRYAVSSADSIRGVLWLLSCKSFWLTLYFHASDFRLPVTGDILITESNTKTKMIYFS